MRIQRLQDARIAGTHHSLIAILLTIVLFSSGCASLTGKSRGQIAVEPEGGFSITEQIEASAEDRDKFDRALQMLNIGKYDEGIALLEDIVASSPEATAAQLNLGMAYALSGDLDRAEEGIRSAISLNPKHPVAYNELGIVYRKMGRFKKAREAYENALDEYADFHYARRNLAILCDVYLADVKCAVKNYEIYRELVPEDEAVAMWLADLRNRTEE